MVALQLRRSFLALALVVSGLACTGDEGSECRADVDCSAELVCVGPSEPRGCGVPPQEGCSSDTDCGDGTVCHAIVDTCSPDQIGSECRPPCSEGSCGEGFVCEPGRGACVAIACADGYACASWEACEAVDPAAPVHAQTHGCVAIACERDEQCPSGDACVNGRCQDEPGACGPVELIP